jgi:hypothetical protein
MTDTCIYVLDFAIHMYHERALHAAFTSIHDTSYEMYLVNHQRCCSWIDEYLLKLGSEQISSGLLVL